MIAPLQKKFATLESEKATLLSNLTNLSVDRLRFRPNANTWSIFDVLDHLVRVENSIMKMVRENLPDGNPITLRDRLGSLIVTSVMKTTIRVKVPAQATMVLPQEISGLPEIHARWNAAREEMSSLLSSLQNSQMQCGLFRHPIGGWMTMAQTLGFISAHLQHHVYQTNRLQVTLQKT